MSVSSISTPALSANRKWSPPSPLIRGSLSTAWPVTTIFAPMLTSLKWIDMTFLENYQLLKQSIPVPAVSIGFLTQNCEMVDMVYSSNNCQHCFDCFRLENSVYCTVCMGKNLIDSNYCMNCELCYSCLDCNQCYGSTYLKDCNSCQNCHFSALCISCTDCFGCVGLTHKEYCIFNRQHTKEEYQTQVKELREQDPAIIQRQVESLKKTIPHPQSQQFNNQNCPYGDYLYDSKNVFWGFNTYWLEDCGYIFQGGIDTKQCWDMYFSGNGMERCYQMTDCGKCYDSAFLFSSGGCANCYYSSYLIDCTDCFGCVGLTNKKYCFLNNQLTKERYEQTVAQIKKELSWRTGNLSS